MSPGAIVRLGGASLVLGALAFVAVFAYLAARFDYPGVLDGPAREVLPALRAMGVEGRGVWAVYAFLPLLWIPAAAGALEGLGPRRRGAMRMALAFAIVATLAMMLGLMRWPTIHWRLADAYAVAGPGERAVIEGVFDGLNAYLGRYLGEFLGELSFNAFFLLTAGVWLAERTRPRWIGYAGIVTGVAGLVGMLRNVTAAVALVAEVNNALLPAYMIVLGIGVYRLAPRDVTPEG